MFPKLTYPANMEDFVQKHKDLKEKFPDLPMVDITMQARLYYYSYLSIRAKQAAYRQASPVKELVHILSQLSNLEIIIQPELVLLSDEPDTELPLHIGVACTSWRESDLQYALMTNESAGAFRSLKSLSVIWDLCLNRQYWDRYAFHFDCLETLELHVDRTREYGFPCAFEQFLQSAQNVTHLVIASRKQLDLQLRTKNPERSISKAWTTVFKQQFQKLKRLWLRFIVCTEEDLTSFLIGHRATLEELFAQDLILRNWKHRSPYLIHDNSVVRFLWVLKHILTLQDFEVHDYIANDGTECWMADQNSQSGVLYDKIAAFVCCAGPFPSSQQVPYVVPPTWLRLANLGSAGHDRIVDEFQDTKNLVATSEPPSDALISLVKSDLRNFSHGNLSALADTLPASDEDLDKLFEVLKGYSDGSWEYLVNNDSPEQSAGDGPTVNAQSNETP